MIRTGFYFLLFYCVSLAAMDLKKEVELECRWRIEIGDDEAYKNPRYNDSHWEGTKVPNSWENEGFPGYNGYAWYRISFEIPKRLKGKKLYLKLGRIDDVDTAYLNGNVVGSSGSYPPDYQTAYQVDRLYPVDEKFINFGRINVLAVRVFDDHGEGGIVRGDCGLYSRKDIIHLEIDMNGYWAFMPGDEADWKSTDFNDTKWHEILVPAEWEDRGFRELDGIAWYRKNVRISRKLAKEKLILLLGKINDVDEVYFNGVLIGQTGRFPTEKDDGDIQDKKKIDRAYFIPPDAIRPGRDNLVAVRVYDAGRTGGIFDGDVGITTREEYLRFTKRNK
ncbi:glycoside hydrolase [candidate division KSB1 bacterium]|nr:glycoside hydrolase [candidate division KSB1 bacterium]